MLARIRFLSVLPLLFVLHLVQAKEKTISLDAITRHPLTLEAEADESRVLTWWLPSGFDVLTLPMSGGVRFDWSDSRESSFLKQRNEWDMKELPLLGARYGAQTLALYIPWPHYATLVTEEKVGLRFSFPEGRNNTTPCNVVAQWVGNESLAIANGFRAWRQSASEIGGIPRARSLAMKKQAFPRLQQLFGAAHFYLWGKAGFSRHDVNRSQWIPLARAILGAEASSFAGRMRASFSAEQKMALNELAKSEWPMKYLTITVAGGIDKALFNPAMASIDATNLLAAYEQNRNLLVSELGRHLRPAASWGDGLSVSLIDELNQSGIEKALLLMSDLYETSARRDAVEHAETFGYFVGPYDSYHSVHSPEAHPDETWSTAQFDLDAFTTGKVIKEKGRRQGGFKGRGFHFSPEAAWPYVQTRVGKVRRNNGYSAWFIDCDATGECFDDYSPHHAATRVDDVAQRRDRLRWLEKDQGLLVGSEGGSILFADVIHFGHGVHTPYIGHLVPSFRDRESPHFLGRHWPPDSPEQSFKAVPLPPSLETPYFDPLVRVPLYQAVLGDELIATHHWSFDSLKFKGLEATRALLEILYGVPPMYHLNREMWPKRKYQIVKHLAFWSPLHEAVASARLIQFEFLTENRLIQQSQFRAGDRTVSVTVNFGERAWDGLPGMAARVVGVGELEGLLYRAQF